MDLRGVSLEVAHVIEEIDVMNFLLAVHHVTPRTGKGRIRFTRRGATVQWGTVRIEPGDWIVVDRTGAVIIPASKVDDIARRAPEIEATDSNFVHLLEQSIDFDEARRRLGHF